jgi:hypothetical protein
MLHNKDQSKVPLSDWETFQKGFSPFLIEEVVDREKIELPDWFTPPARGVAIASTHLLKRVGYHCGMRRPPNWFTTRPYYFRLPLSDRNLLVRQCSHRLWTVERYRTGLGFGWEDGDEALVFNFGPTPIFTRGYVQAMRLAMHCQDNEPPLGLSWRTSRAE